MNRAIFPIILSLLAFSFFHCGKSQEKSTTQSADFPYNLNSPDQEYSLPESLREISGLSYLSSDKLACIQDEEGVLFIFDTRQSKIAEEIQFGKSGDYEGIEVIGNKVYVIKSNGKILSFDIGKPNEVIEISTPLTQKNDIEGLGYDPINNTLLIACKAKAEVSGNGATGKAIYSYDLHQNKFLEEPVLVIKEGDVKGGKSNKIKPSGVAVHPKTGEHYILASSHQVFVFKDKALSNTIPLDPSIFTQPEGICFSEDGTLFISSEGGDFGSGKIFRFNVK
jgi:uncharacterized protein YjiK